MILIILETLPLDWILNISLHLHQHLHQHIRLRGTADLRYLREHEHGHRTSSATMIPKDLNFPVQTVHLPQLGEILQVV